MEKLITCVGCSKDFKVLGRPDKPTYGQHEVESNVECPHCSRTNAIVWPQGDYHVVVPIGTRVSEQIRSGILYLAKELIGGRLSAIEGSRKLSAFHHDVGPDLAEILVTFVGIASETDALPIGKVRKEWNCEALEQKDREIVESESFYRDSAMKAAAELIRLLEDPR